ncbi:DUF6243 family protein [Streptomyces sp. NPDC059176]|uniref:DUF6243 family protein n=1 Tax=unclassified Streptomyces TaxID=2593676 RepID=UPI0036C2A8BE
MGKGRNNLLGVGGQRRKVSRADQRGNGQARSADRQTSVDQKQELLRKMRERAQGEQFGPQPAARGSAEGGRAAED